MKLSIKVSELRDSLGMVGAVVPSTTVIPILQSVKFEAGDGTLVLSANNIETAVSHKVLAQVELPGGICVPYQSFAGWLGAMDADKMVLIEADYETFSIKAKCGKFKTGFRGFDANEFPLTEFEELPVSFGIEAEALKQVIGNTAFAMSMDDSRPILKGVNFAIDDILTVVAANGFRLALDQAEIEAGISEMVSVTITGESVRVLQKVLSKVSGAVNCDVTQGKVVFKTDDDVISCALIDARYPDVMQIVPKHSSKKAVVNKAELKQVLRSAAPFVKDGADVVVFEAGDNILNCKDQNSQIGPFEVNLDIDYEGEPCSFGLNRSYLEQVLNVIEGDSVSLSFNSGDSPFVIKGGGTGLYLIMPMHIR